MSLRHKHTPAFGHPSKEGTCGSRQFDATIDIQCGMQYGASAIPSLEGYREAGGYALEYRLTLFFYYHIMKVLQIASKRQV